MPSTKRVSHRGSLLKGVAVYRVLYQSILNAKLTGRKNLGRKRCTSNRDDCKLENTVKQSWFKHWLHLWASQGVDWSWSQCIKSHHAQKSSGKGLPRHFWTRDNIRSVLPGLWRNEHTFQKANNSLKMFFFLLVLWSILICWDMVELLRNNIKKTIFSETTNSVEL